MVGEATGAAWVPLVVFVGVAVVVVAISHALDPRGLLVPLVIATGSAGLSFAPGVAGTLGTPASGRPFGALGYANASGFLYLVAALACVMIAVDAREHGPRLLAGFGATGFVVAMLGSRSIAAAGLGALSLATLLGVRRAGVRPVAIASVLLVVGTLAATLALGATYRPDAVSGATPHRLAAEALSERRLVLWHEALDLIRAGPTTGTGVGGFAEQSPTARADVDVFTPHSSYLLAGVELGVTGLVLLLATIVWANIGVWRGHPTTGAVGGAVITAAALHGSIDYVLESPAIVLAVLALVATAARGPTAAARP